MADGCARASSASFPWMSSAADRFPQLLRVADLRGLLRFAGCPVGVAGSRRHVSRGGTLESRVDDGRIRGRVRVARRPPGVPVARRPRGAAGRHGVRRRCGRHGVRRRCRRDGVRGRCRRDGVRGRRRRDGVRGGAGGTASAGAGGRPPEARTASEARGVRGGAGGRSAGGAGWSKRPAAPARAGEGRLAEARPPAAGQRCRLAVEPGRIQRRVQPGRRGRPRAGSGPTAHATHGPGATTLARQHALSDRDLLFLGGQLGRRGVLAAAVRGPGACGELDTAVVAVAGVDSPVAAGLATGYLIPFAVGGRGRLAGEGDAAATKHRPGNGDLGDADARSGGLTVTSTHTRRNIPLS